MDNINPVSPTAQPGTQPAQPAEDAVVASSEVTVPNITPTPAETHQDQIQPDPGPSPVQVQESQPVQEQPIQDGQKVQPVQPAQSPVQSEPTITEPPQSLETSQVFPLAEKIMPAHITPDQAALFKSWLTKYLKSLRVLGTLGLQKKRQRHMDKVVELLNKHGSLTQLELGHLMRMNTVSIGQYVHALIAQGRIRHVGSMHHGRYEKV